MGNIAFNALRDLRFKSMIIRLDGDLAGEFASRLAIDGVGLGQTSTQRIIRSLLSKIPLKLNVTITGPFRALIATAKSFTDPRQVIERRPSAPARGRAGHHHRGPPLEEETAADPDPCEATGQRRPATQPAEVRKTMTIRIARPGLLAAALLAAPLASCISVKAPDKPIEINLNVTIRQEVLVRLQRDVEQLINQNPQAFPQTAEEAMSEAASSCCCLRLAVPAAAQTPGGRCGARRGRVGERYDGYLGRRRAGLSRGPQPGRARSTSSGARSIPTSPPARASARRTSGSPPAASCWRGSGVGRSLSCRADGDMAAQRGAAGSRRAVPELLAAEQDAMRGAVD